jgi:hypothetical protein
MATVTVYTAARMAAIEANAIVSGAVVGNDLILTKYNSSTINAGNVRGATGIQGPTGATGEVSNAALTAALNALKLTVYGAVNHGATAGTARPTGFFGIIWYGSVQPTNATGTDIVIRTDEAI